MCVKSFIYIYSNVRGEGFRRDDVGRVLPRFLREEKLIPGDDVIIAEGEEAFWQFSVFPLLFIGVRDFCGVITRGGTSGGQVGVDVRDDSLKWREMRGEVERGVTASGKMTSHDGVETVFGEKDIDINGEEGSVASVVDEAAAVLEGIFFDLGDFPLLSNSL